MKVVTRVLRVVGLLLLAAWAFRRPMLDWGATRDEACAELPGDGLVPGADIVATRAISIDVPPSLVWPWLVQIGTGRAGAYSYDWLDRLAGLDMVSSRQILPEFQDLEVGDVIPVDNNGTGPRVREMETGRFLSTLTDDGSWAWTWVLDEAGTGTRLVSRTRMSTLTQSAIGRWATYWLLIPASWVMERKMLLGIKERAEGESAIDRSA